MRDLTLLAVFCFSIRSAIGYVDLFTSKIYDVGTRDIGTVEETEYEPENYEPEDYESGDYESGDYRSRESEKKTKSQSVVDFYHEAIPSVLGFASKNKTMDILRNTFLSLKKADSIWPKVIDETKRWFGKRRSRKELEVIQRHLFSFRRLLISCHTEFSGKERTRCLSKLAEEFTLAAEDFFWENDPNTIDFYISFSMMRLCFLQLFKRQLGTNYIRGVNIDRTIINVADEFSENLNKTGSKICGWRRDQVTSVRICKVVDILWQEFELHCEFRWKRSVAENEETTEESGDWNDMVTQGHEDDFKDSYRARVTDEVSKQIIFDKKMTVSNKYNKAQLIHKLYNDGKDTRSEYVKYVNKACHEYVNSHIIGINRQIWKLWGMPKKKLKKERKYNIE